MKERILEIIHLPPQAEPIYLLDHEYRRLNNDEQRNEFLSAIKFLALNGSAKEKIASLTVIDFIKKAKECEDVIRACVADIEIKDDEQLIRPLLWLSATLSTRWSIDFIRTVLKYFKPQSSKYDYDFFDSGIRGIASTTYWVEALHEIRWALENNDTDYIVDFFAYFKWKHGEVELEELFLYVPDNVFLIDDLETRIGDRYTNYEVFSP